MSAKNRSSTSRSKVRPKEVVQPAFSVTLQKSQKTGLYTFVSDTRKLPLQPAKKKQPAKKALNQRLAGSESKVESSFSIQGDRIDKESNLTEDSAEGTMEQVNKDEQRQKELENEYRKKVFLLPSCSQWFDLDEIHEIEIQALPEFFCKKYPQKNPINYKTFRNLIIKLFRENPSTYLSAATCRKHVPADVCSIHRLHSFLEQWGIINFNVEPLLKPAKLMIQGSGHIDQTLINAATKGFIKLKEAEQLQKSVENATDSNSDQVHILAAKKIQLLSKQKRPACNSCGDMCGQHWYKQVNPANSHIHQEKELLEKFGEENSLHHVLKQLVSSYILCDSCHKDKRFPRSMNWDMFELVSVKSLLTKEPLRKCLLGQQLDDDEMDLGGGKDVRIEEGFSDPQREGFNEWSYKDIQILIDGVAEYDQDWEQISQLRFEKQHSPDDCLFQFLRLPIDESLQLRFQDNQAISSQSTSVQSKKVEHHEQESFKYMEPSIFCDTSNPLLQQIGIFAQSLEQYEQEDEEFQSNKEKYLWKKTNQLMNQDQGLGIFNGKASVSSEKRTTRGQQANNPATALQSSQKKEDPEALLMEKEEPVLSKEICLKVKERAEANARRLAKQERKEVNKLMGLLLEKNVKKLQLKMELIRDFQECFQIEREELQEQKEEIFVQRVCLTQEKNMNRPNLLSEHFQATALRCKEVKVKLGEKRQQMEA